MRVLLAGIISIRAETDSSAGPLANKVFGLLLLEGGALAGSLTKPPENSLHSEVFQDQAKPDSFINILT